MRILLRVAAVAAILSVLSCTKEDFGISSIENPRAEKQISMYGETVTVTFYAEGAWNADLVLAGGEEWAEISQTLGNGKAGKGTVRVRFSKNNEDKERTASLYVTVSGKDRMLVATFTQAAGENVSAMSRALNEYMHNILKEDYLWAEQYNALDIDMSLSYDKFLYTHLTQLGNVNIEDGGIYRAYSASAGERYIYSNISEVTSAAKSTVMTRAGELASTYGLGIGPLFASLFQDGTNYIGLTVGYVYPGSPAETAGLRRGDTIYQVNATRITRTNYQNFMQELFYEPSGSYTLIVARYEANEEDKRYDLKQNIPIEVTAGTYGYNPVLYAAVLKNSNVDSADDAGDSADDSEKLPDFCIGYMASESFDSSAQEVLEYQIQQFIDEGITELILDLRFNVGGEVQQSRYLASSIVGSAHDEDIFFKALFNDGRKEEWSFRSGPAEEDHLGEAKKIPGLNRLWVIMSENTASASELIINALKGIDFPVVLIGSRSEGKNVGMVVTQTVYNGRRFDFAPITYWGLNGRDEKAPADGFEPDEGNRLNNQDSSYRNDIDNMFPYSFGDWGNFDFNIALYCCFCDIVGRERPEYQTDDEKEQAAVRSLVRYDRKVSAAMLQTGIEPLGVTQVRPQIGRFGSVIYGKQK